MQTSNVKQRNKVDIQDLKRLAGIQNNSAEPSMGENLSHTGTAKAEYQRKHNIRPGTPEWFRLWFAQPKLTGEDPMPRSKK
jgi:hypothetical protein